MILVCGSSLSHRFGGKLFDTPVRTLRKWALKLRMTTSTALCWHPGSTNSMSNLHVSQMWFVVSSDILLSGMCSLGTMPACFSHSRSALYERINSASLRLFIGSTRMALLPISTIAMMYLLPC